MMERKLVLKISFIMILVMIIVCLKNIFEGLYYFSMPLLIFLWIEILIIDSIKIYGWKNFKEVDSKWLLILIWDYLNL